MEALGDRPTLDTMDAIGLIERMIVLWQKYLSLTMKRKFFRFLLRGIIVHFGGIKFQKAMRGETLTLIQPRISEIKCYQPVVVYIKARLKV